MTATSPHLYVIGIGGVGMLWIADYALSQGWRVSGSDITTSAQIERLKKRGANIHIGTNPDAIPNDITEAVMTAAATPGSLSFPEVEELRRRGVPLIKRAEWIGKLTRQKYTICVAGAHGKTTTTAMIGWILTQAGLDPTVFVGGSIAAWDNMTRVGKSQYLVLEADEFDRSFHRFVPQIAVLLNIDLDHTDYYTGGLPEIEHAFHRFLRNLPYRKGIVIAYGRDAAIRKATKGFSYAFRWYDEAHLWPGVRVPQPGSHYLLNATAAARVAHELGISNAVIKKALASFPGVSRRFEYKGTWNKVEVYDDYAHHPREIAALLSSLRAKFPQENMTMVFQPHQKARTHALLKEFARAFDANAPTTLILAPIYYVAGREDALNITSADLGVEIQSKKVPFSLSVAGSEAELETLVRAASLQPGILVTVGAGSINTLVDAWRQT